MPNAGSGQGYFFYLFYLLLTICYFGYTLMQTDKLGAWVVAVPILAKSVFIDVAKAWD